MWSDPFMSTPAGPRPGQQATQTGGAAVVSALRDNGVDLVFGIPGTHNLEIYRHLPAAGIRHVTPRHEQGGGYAADGYSRVSGRPGVVVTTSGPGLTNVTTAAATAYADSVPLLVISPGVPVGRERADVGGLHEVKDQRAHLDALLDRSIRVSNADDAAVAVHEIFATWATERPRPVHLEVPVDVLEGPWQPRSLVRPSVAPRSAGDQAAVETAARLLAEGRRIVIVVGGGGRDAGAEIRRLAELLDVPVITTVNAKGTLDERHPLAVGASIRLAPAQAEIDAADVLLVVGSELADSDLWGGTLSPAGSVIRIDLDVRQLHKNVVADVPIHGDASLVVAALAERLEPRAGSDGAPRAARLRADVERAALVDGDQWREVQDVLRSALPDDAIVAGDSAKVSYYGTVHFWPMSGPRRFLYPTGYATLGYGLPAAIGAKLAAPDRAVVTLVGDGGFLFSAQELSTAAELRLPLPIVLMNNHGFGEIRDQMLERGIEPLGVDIDGIDFPALARAFGGHGQRVDAIGDLPELVLAALDVPGPTLLEVDLPAK